MNMNMNMNMNIVKLLKQFF